MKDRNTSKKKRIGLIILLLLVIAAVVVVVVNPFKNFPQIVQGQLPGEGEGESSDEETVIAVRVEKSSSGELRDYIKTNGDVVDTKTVDVYPEVSGNLTFLDVEVGDRVTKDTLLAKVDPSRPGMVYRETKVDAPVDGTVLAVNFAVGATVSPQAALVRIGLLDSLEVEVAIAERFIGNVAIGSETEAVFKAYPGQKFTGKVVSLSPVLHPATRTLKVNIALDDPQGLIKVGMFPSVMIYTDRVEAALLIARESILYEGSQAYVYVVDDQMKIHRKNISLGLVVDEVAQVTEGLENGESVVVQGQTLLTEGATVQIVD
ncbi:MAG TPA: hypothetical protein DIW48_05440 [Sphaerochaeta sp.]|nr:MAG: hypothetical protein A2Y31_02915 [Spirochaetes bacterium GWC2_52_13]HCG64791.1 hypothetical protein [Sphaerochaeta sp.]HCS36128.1 hypothetical protein [Sphaerochaeta sp.]